MGLSYPIAANARSALLLQDDAYFTATITTAKEIAGGPVVLASEWLKPTADESDELVGCAEMHAGRGFVQVYADAEGDTVFAVSYWKLQSPAEHRKAEEDEARLRAQHAREHTNDIYFTKPEHRRKRFPGGARRSKNVHPDQLDLFGDD